MIAPLWDTTLFFDLLSINVFVIVMRIIGLLVVIFYSI